MYRELEAEMLKKGVVRKDIAKLLGLSYGTVCMRFRRKPEFSVDEAFTIRDYLCPSKPIDELFSKADNGKTPAHAMREP